MMHIDYVHVTIDDESSGRAGQAANASASTIRVVN